MKKNTLISLILGAVALAGSGLHATVTFTDDFNRASTSAGNIGPDWTVYNNGFYINSNVVKTQTTGSNIAILNNYQLDTSFDISADFYSQSNSRYGGLIFNYVDSNNYYIFRANFASSGSTVWQFLKIEGETQTLLDSGNVVSGGTGLMINNWYSFNVSSSATAGSYDFSITDITGTTVYASGTVSDSTFAIGGQTGFDFESTYGWVDNFSLTTVPEPRTNALILAAISMASVLVWRRRRNTSV